MAGNKNSGARNWHDIKVSDETLDMICYGLFQLSYSKVADEAQRNRARNIGERLYSLMRTDRPNQVDKGEIV